MAICGIDLGTTHSLIAVFENAQPRLLPNALGDVLTPSVVSLDEHGELLVGRPAADRLLTHADRSVADFKRLMGTEHVTRLDGRPFRPEELSALVLRALKADAEASLGMPVSEAIISVPAYFNDVQRKATLDAGRLAGLKVERLVNEPTAAALAYGLGLETDGKFLVFDLGGGTFDVSILDKYDGVMEIRATAGDTRLGGNDFTAVIEGLLAERHKLVVKSLAPTALAQLRRAAEALKRALTRDAEAGYAFDIGGTRHEGSLARAVFEREAQTLLRRLRAPVERAIGDATLAPADLDAVVLVGGATRMPMVRSLVARLFGRLPLAHVDPDTTVALGAAVQAGLKARDAALEDTVMTDVCPFTLGIASVEDLGDANQLIVTPIIERNAVVPISRSKSFQTIHHNQTAIDIDVYQGEHLRPADNVHLGSFKIAVPRAPAGKESVEVRFTYDINGALEVEAKVRTTGTVSTKIFRNATRLSEAELEQRFQALAAIKLPPREQAENRALLARAERVYAELRGERRQIVIELIRQFSSAIERQQARDVAEQRRQLAEALDDLERSSLPDA
jgi:molecular chaperone HscC